MILLSKYSDHLPLYRQEKIFKTRYGVTLSRKTMCDWVWQVAHQLAMIYEALRREIRCSGYMQVDETPVAYLDPGSGKCSTGYLWTYRAECGVLFDWFTSRSMNCLAPMLSGYSGVLQTDGYAAYEGYMKQAPDREGMELAACWAHARRKFFEAREETPLAARVLAQINKLYRIEAGLRDQQADEDMRLAVRQEKSLPVLHEIEKSLREAQSTFLPQSLSGKAVAYTLGLWERLMVYTRHGRMEIDNNLVENAIRPVALGKKNWLFFGSAGAGRSSAIIFSLLESCRKLDIDPNEYLRDVLKHLPTMTNQTARAFTPSNWKASRCAPAA